MSLSKAQLWERFQRWYFEFPAIEMTLDLSRIDFRDGFVEQMQPAFERALEAMEELERGAIANPDEQRMVGHYWLRSPELAPTAEIRRAIEENVVSIKAFAREVHEGLIQGERGPFKNLLLIGIGGSALGPQFVSHALGHPLRDKMDIYFFDNTDPDGMDKVLAEVVTELGQTLCIVVSKSGGTKETRNGMLEVEAAYRRAGLNFARHSLAVTMAGSGLDQHAEARGWLKRFPMWDWVGGRTSQTSAVGLLPAALQGFDIDQILRGARDCDNLTRRKNVNENPSALISLVWHCCGNGKGEKDMVILPYKDRLELLSRYLQQLIMESLGKEKDLDGKVVNQGLAVYGNKGSTDQHAFVQQLREGVHNFFVTFVQVQYDRVPPSLEVEPGVTSGDYLQGFLLGTRDALYENGRQSHTITLKEVSEYSIGALIALFERAVGLYAALININAYHQPGVEAGKRAAASVLELQRKIVKQLGHQPKTATELSAGLGVGTEQETVFHILEHLAANPDRGIVKERGATPFQNRYRRE